MKRAPAFLAFTLVAYVGIMAALELSSRLVRPTPVLPPVDHPLLGPWMQRDPVLFWRMRPHLAADGIAITNGLGLRGPEIAAKGRDEFRILSLGESSTFAFRLENEQTYSGLVERSLGLVEGKRVRVINAGVPAYTLFQGVTYLEHRGLALEPDAVLSYFGFNDFLPAAERVSNSFLSPVLTDAEFYEENRRPLSRAASWLAEHSNLARLAFHHRRASKGREPSPIRRVRVPLRDRRKLLARLRETCVQNGLRLVIVVPWYRRFTGHTALLREFAAESGVPLVDLPAVLRDPPLPREEYFRDRFHPNAAGHALIAEAIAAGLRALWPEAAATPGPGGSAARAPGKGGRS